MAHTNQFAWMTPEQRATAKWMIHEGLKEKGLEKLAAAVTAFSEFLAQCRADFNLRQERASGKSVTEWN